MGLGLRVFRSSRLGVELLLGEHASQDLDCNTLPLTLNPKSPLVRRGL